MQTSPEGGYAKSFLLGLALACFGAAVEAARIEGLAFTMSNPVHWSGAHSLDR